MVTTDPLNGLLAIRDGSSSARWNFADAVGTPVDAPGGLGNAATVSYSFLAAAPPYYPEPSFQPFNDQQKAATRAVLASVAAVTRVTFTETSGVGTLTYGFSSQGPGTGGYAFFPAFGYSYSGNTIQSVQALSQAGDVWINADAYPPGSDFGPGSEAWATLLHETGHALGLKHPFESTAGGYTLDPSLDDQRHTVMSYTAAPNATLITVTGSQTSYSWTTYDLSPSTLMPFDITALQALYGANTTSRTGNDTYQWAPHAELLETIWDGGGVDTIDCSNQPYACVVNLNGGTYSSIDLRQTDAEIRTGLGLPSFFKEALPSSVYTGRDNLAIAKGVVIENANGGAGPDSLTGNAAANVLDGRAGADTMAGGAGSDTYFVDNAKDVVTEGLNAGTDLLNTTVTFTLPDNVEAGRILAAGAVNLTGNGLANTLYAGSGNNLLTGGAGTDTASYRYAGAAVKVSLALSAAQATGGSGSDTLVQVENLTGSNFNDSLTGGTTANALDGGLGNDVLDGGAGNDTLIGGAGLDTLTGGSGLDVFRFDSPLGAASNVDVIADFRAVDDTLQLVRTVFAAPAAGTLAADSFHAGAGVTTASDANDYFNYNTTNGALYYDADGSGPLAAVRFATLTGHPTLTNADFLLV